MPLYLVDSSVWIDVLGRRQGAGPLRARVDELVEDDTVATTGPVRFELLMGTRSQEEWDLLLSRLAGLVELAANDEHWTEAARIGFQLRRRGIVIPTPDLLIAAVAMAHDAVVVHRDQHFDVIAEHAPLAVESYADPRPDALPD